MDGIEWGALWGATATTVLLWGAVVVSVQWSRKARSLPPLNCWNPLVLNQGPFGRASLSNFQLFFFLVLVIWIVLYLLYGTGELADLSEDVMTLLGLGAAGTAGSKTTATYRRRISSGDWAWLARKGWIEKTLEKEADAPSLGDLVSSDSRFDVTKFQVLAFSLIVGISLVVTGVSPPEAGEAASGLKRFAIDDNYLVLIGLSQLVYVGGKAVSPPTVAQLQEEIQRVRELERAFMKKVSAAWQEDPSKPRDLATAKAVAMVEYNEYRAAADVCAKLVADLTEDDRPRDLDPAVPV